MFKRLRALLKLEKSIEFKVDKVYEFKKGGRYLFAITTDVPINERMYKTLKDTLGLHKERLLKELGIISSFIVLDNNLNIKVLPSGEEKICQ